VLPAVVPTRLYYGWVLVLTLGVTETVSWGVLNYAFTVFVAPMQADLGWSRGAIGGAFSLALLVSGLAAVPVGRWLDHDGPRLLMTAGSCAATLLVLAWAGVRSLPAFYATWAALGLAMAAVLYDPAFAVVTTWFRRHRARAMTVLTLMAGLASTIFVPLAAWLVQAQGWRAALVTLAFVLGALTIPPHALLLRRRPEDLGLVVDGRAAWPPAPIEGVGQGQHPHTVERSLAAGEALRHASFRWVVGAFCLYAFASIAVSVHLVPLLVDRGTTPAFAAGAAGVVGVMQLAGRLVFAPMESRVSPGTLTALVFLVQPAALLTLLLAPGAAGLAAFVVLFGAGRGAATLARPYLVASLYGPARYATIAGAVTLFVTLAQAAGPYLMGAGYDRFGRYDPALWLLVALSTAAAGAAWLAGSAPERAAPPWGN
jgi:MFS family permease